MNFFIVPNNTNLEALRPHLPRCCYAPQWYRIFHHHANGSSVKCANCMTTLTEEQFNESNNLLLTHDAHHDMINKLPNVTKIRVQDIKYEDSVFDYKFEDLELDKGVADVPKCEDLDAEELAFLDHRFRTCRKQATKGLKEPKSLKHDQGKIRVSLLKRFGLALLAVADLGTSGAKKYGDHSWTQVPNGVNRYDDALFGHFLRESFEGQDPEMKQPHEVATAWNALAKLQLLIELDDTWKTRLMKRDMG